MRKNIITAGLALSVATAGLLVGADASMAAVSPSAAAAAVANSVFGSPNPAATYRSLDAVDRAKFDAAELPVSTKVVSKSPGTLTSEDGTTTTVPAGDTADSGKAATAASASFTGTFQASQLWASTATFGNTLYTWHQATKVAIVRGKVTSVTVFNYGYETSTPGWREAGFTKATFNAGWEGRGLVHAKFILGVGGVDVQHTDNCGQIRLNANASLYQVSTSCSLN